LHISSLKEFRENKPVRFNSHHIDKPAPSLIGNLEQREEEQILYHRCQNNRHEFLVPWKYFECVDDFRELMENHYY